MAGKLAQGISLRPLDQPRSAGKEAFTEPHSKNAVIGSMRDRHATGGLSWHPASAELALVLFWG
jgi:hypothetical protein